MREREEDALARGRRGDRGGVTRVGADVPRPDAVAGEEQTGRGARIEVGGAHQPPLTGRSD